MAKNETPKQGPTTAEQLAVALAAEQKAVEDKQLELDEAASFKTLVKAGAKPLADVKEAWLLFLDAVKRLDDLTKEQAVAVKAAKEHAAANGLQSVAQDLGHGPLVATSMANMADVPWPCVMNPTFYVSQFPNDEARWMNIQLALNQGAPVVAPGVSNEQIAKALLSGVSVPELQSKGIESPELKKLQSDASGWFGFKPKKAAVQSAVTAQ